MLRTIFRKACHLHELRRARPDALDDKNTSRRSVAENAPPVCISDNPGAQLLARAPAGCDKKRS